MCLDKWICLFKIECMPLVLSYYGQEKKKQTKNWYKTAGSEIHLFTCVDVSLYLLIEIVLFA